MFLTIDILTFVKNYHQHFSKYYRDSELKDNKILFTYFIPYDKKKD